MDPDDPLRNISTRQADRMLPPENGRARQCSATSRAGTRCSRAPIPGGFVCRMHGGGNAEVIAAARARLLALVDPALAGLTKGLKTQDACPVCHRSDDMSTVLKAAQLVLDRAGFGPKSTVQVETPDEKPPWSSYLTDTQLDQVIEWVEAAKERALQEA